MVRVPTLRDEAALKLSLTGLNCEYAAEGLSQSGAVFMIKGEASRPHWDQLARTEASRPHWDQLDRTETKEKLSKNSIGEEHTTSENLLYKIFNGCILRTQSILTI
jgi:hypothetical protein